MRQLLSHVILLVLLTTSMFSMSSESQLDEASAAEVEFLSADQAFKFSYVKAIVNRDSADTNFSNAVSISIDIAPGYYLYKSKIKVMLGNQVLTNVDLPRGSAHSDEYFGEQEVYRDELNFILELSQTALENEVKQEAELKIRYQGCADLQLCYPPITQKILLADLGLSLDLAQTQTAEQTKSEPATNAGELDAFLDSENVAWSLFVFFLLGLGLSFTPCVFPMYPILTGIIVGQGEAISVKRGFLLSFFYVQGMAITYTMLGVIVAFAGMQFQAAFQHPAVLIGLSILFVVLALSMFGVINLALPASLQLKLNAMSNQQQGGSYVGVTLMGVISGLVASPCTTAPLTAALLYIAQDGNVLFGASALYALSIGMGIPLLILGSSGGKLLPRAGAWMNVIKSIFGFLLLAVPVLLLQRFIPEFYGELLSIALLLSFSIYLYVANGAKSGQDGSAGFWYGVRSLVIFLMLFFASHQAYDLLVPKTSNNMANNSAQTQERHFKQVASLTELQSEIALATQTGKTVIVDLYADWCIACKEFEKYTFNQANVQNAFENSVLLQVNLTDSSSALSKEVMKQFNVLGLPTILLFDKAGNELTNSRVTGYMSADLFTAHLEQHL
ncbi:protein-disulfide reductase DsbD [Psychrosphaera saromensis]|uniref:Thiol:disulfide interchange protein DsbD n=2 Tax=Psychrosphaera saromensis TaxID=716813 RepID=A0A2S7V135_9GAMM|nr:protein-disulfide reductase DsbD [Psychrosphaera saromensis]